MRPLQRLLPRDPRDLQIAFLASFLVLGVAFLRLPIEPWMPPLLLASTYNQLRRYGFVLLYLLILTPGFNILVVTPYRMILSWLPAK